MVINEERENQEIEEDVIDCDESDFNTNEFEEVKLFGKRKFRFYEKLRSTIDGYSNKKLGDKGNEVVQYLLLLPDLFMLICRLTVDKRVPVGKKVFLGAVLTYLISPIDFIPDFIPVIGYTDDLVLAVFALNNLLNDIDQNIILENWSGKDNILDVIQNVIKSSEKFLDKNILNKIKRWIWKRK